MRTRLAVIVVLLLALGLVIGPRKPSTARVDPRVLLSRLLSVHSGRLIRSNYTPLVEGEERIAGRDAWVLRLKPNVKQRPWRQIWVDKKTFSILAVRDWSHSNIVRGSSRLDQTPSVRFVTPGNPGGMRPSTAALRGLTLPSYVPAGFELVDVGAWRDTSSIRHVIYSDGLFNISLFYGFSSRQGREQQERLHVFDCGKVLAVSVPLATGSVMAVADLPEEEMLRIARSIR